MMEAEVEAARGLGVTTWLALGLKIQESQYDFIDLFCMSSHVS